jgi:hypothetical protein
MLGNGRCSQHDIAKPIPLVAIEISLSSKLLNPLNQVILFISHFLYLPHIFLLYRLLLSPMPSRSLCIPLPLLVCLFRRLRVVDLNSNGRFTAWQRHKRLLAFSAHDGSA